MSERANLPIEISESIRLVGERSISSRECIIAFWQTPLTESTTIITSYGIFVFFRCGCCSMLINRLIRKTLAHRYRRCINVISTNNKMASYSRPAIANRMGMKLCCVRVIANEMVKLRSDTRPLSFQCKCYNLIKLVKW